MITSTSVRPMVSGFIAVFALSALGVNAAMADGSGRSYDDSLSAYATPYRVSHPGNKHGKGHPRYNQNRATPSQYRNDQNKFAKVVNVDPILESVSYQVPHQQCWTEQVRYDAPSRSQRSATPALLGTVIGAVIGNNLGKGHHSDDRAAKTLAGGLLGASIGYDIGARQQSRSAPAQYRQQQQCRTDYETRWEQQVVGYDVSYRFRGETYHTRMDYDPGDKIVVNVQVRPVL